MPPQLAAGAGMPNPRKLSAASVRMVNGTSVLYSTMIGARMLGRRCRVRITGTGQPIATAASTYVFCRALRVAPRMMRVEAMPQ